MLLEDKDINNETRYKAGDVIFKEDSIGETAFLLSKGLVRLTTSKNAEHTVRIISAGQLLGEIDWMNKSRRLFTATALEPSVCIHIKSETLIKQYEKTPPSIQATIRSMLNTIKGMKGDATLITVEHVKRILSGEDPDGAASADIVADFIEDEDSFDVSIKDKP